MKIQVSKTNHYSKSERFLHRCAFASGGIQKKLATIETAFFQQELKSIKVENPVFIAGLPRSGSTILLRIIASQSDFATLRYTQMPFVSLPLVWGKYTRFFSKKTIHQQERLHGDGILIDKYSPEALDEPAWKMWADDYPAMQMYMRKVIALYTVHYQYAQRRYLSKNQHHSHRISLLLEWFPDGMILVPFRDPMQQAISLLRQHQRFVAIQSENTFVADYMRYLGHDVFGVDAQQEDDRESKNITRWLTRWLSGYQELLNYTSDQLVWIDFDEMVKSPHQEITKLSKHLNVADTDVFLEYALSQLHTPKAHPRNEISYEKEVLVQCMTLHERMKRLTHR